MGPTNAPCPTRSWKTALKLAPVQCNGFHTGSGDSKMALSCPPAMASTA